MEHRLDELESRLEQQWNRLQEHEVRLVRYQGHSTDRHGNLLLTDGGDSKVVGEFGSDSGTGILGKATGDGETCGVHGETTSEDGYGLATSADVGVEGTLELEVLSGELTGREPIESLAGDGLDIVDGELVRNAHD